VRTVPHRLRVLDDRVLRVLEDRVLRVLEDVVLRVLEDRVLRVLEDRVLRVLEDRVLRVLEEGEMRVLEDRGLRKIFGSTTDQVSGEWRRLHKEKHNDLNSSPDIIRVIKPRRITWVGHVACMGERRGTGFSYGNLQL
jgi:hypothetical protein